MSTGEARGRVVLMVLASPGPAVPVHLRSVVPRLEAHGLVVHLAVAEHLVGHYGGLGSAVVPLPVAARSSTAGDVAATRHLRRAVRAVPGADVVHAHGFRSGALATIALRGLRSRPGFVTTWYDLALPTGARVLSVRAAERLIARSADVTLATSTELQQRVRGLGARDVRLAPIAPIAARSGEAADGAAVPDAERAALRARLAPELGLQPERPWVLVVGRLVPERSGMLLSVADRWNVLHPPPEVLAVGEGPPAVVPSLRQAVAARGLPVHLLGDRTDTVDLMRACDVLVTTSRWESRPLAVQQAMQLGLPVVAARLAGIAELVSDTGVLVDVDDVDSLAGEVAALLADPERAQRLARRAVRRAGTFPSENEVAESLLAAYADAAGPRTRRRP
ncbi:MAG: glycosyltransferase family 4 protein [Kineosporiaceae bacterium]